MTQKVTPLHLNPLMRWSKGLAWPRAAPSALPRRFDALVGMGGGGTAFNATNTVRTALYFSCSSPPHMINATSAADIQSLQRHPQACDGSNSDTEGETNMCFGREAFDANDWPLIAFENYVAGASSIHSRRLGTAHTPRRLVIGHENHGVDSRYLHHESNVHHESANGAATERSVIYIPQYGTSSSLNVVTCLGIGLFYSYLDALHPESRSLITTETSDNSTTSLPSVSTLLWRRYTLPYSLMLPRSAGNTPSDVDGSPSQGGAVEGQPCTSFGLSRVDQRPIHPLFYLRDEPEIRDTHGQFLEALAERKLGPVTRSLVSGRPLFGLSLLYENDFDQRNLGGLLRNANAFLVDHVFYVGRKKLNIKGAVGAQHYSPPIYLGRCPNPGEKGATANAFDVHMETMLHSALHNRNIQFLMLSTGQEFLYTSSLSAGVPGGASCLSSELPADATRDTSFASHPESARLFHTLVSQGCSSNLFLTQSEEQVRQFFGEGGRRYVVLLIPQEGKLPHPALMQRVEGVVHVRPRHEDGDEHRGLPSQVAGGIALQRWCSCAHPELRW